MKPNLSKPAKGHKVYPYLLRNANITKPNQAWSIDITYIRLKHGFVYLTAIIDWYSRLIVGWELDDTLSSTMIKCALEKAFAVAKPQILNSDQGSQFTGHEYINYVESNKVKISMDGKSRWADNICFIVAFGLQFVLQPYPQISPDVISVRQTGILPRASFRFRLTMDTLASGYTLPATGRVRDFL